MHPLANGLIGAVTLTAIHETGRRVVDDPPRMDVVGMRGLRPLLRAAGQEPPEQPRLFALTLAGDILHNAIYYAAVGRGRSASVWTRGAALGLAAGLGAVTLPERIGLGTPPHNERLRTRVLTIAYYLAGGLAAAAAARCTATRGALAA